MKSKLYHGLQDPFFLEDASNLFFQLQLHPLPSLPGSAIVPEGSLNMLCFFMSSLVFMHALPSSAAWKNSQWFCDICVDR